jgi:hypothetical protein
MSPRNQRRLLILTGVAAVAGLALLFPRVLEFAELGARELRYFWWLIAILALGIWLAFFFGKRRE